jgi:hypothetical protein
LVYADDRLSLVAARRPLSPMTPAQYKAAIKALGLSQERAGDWLGIGRRTSQGYALGEYPVPEPVAKLLRLCVKMKLNPEDVK